MADSQIPTDSPDIMVQAALMVMFTPETDNNNPRSRATAMLSRDALKAMYTYKVTPTFKMSGDQLASHLPPDHVIVYIPHDDTRMILPLSRFL